MDTTCELMNFNMVVIIKKYMPISKDMIRKSRAKASFGIKIKRMLTKLGKKNENTFKQLNVLLIEAY